jgi:hypothetical protein
LVTDGGVGRASVLPRLAAPRSFVVPPPRPGRQVRHRLRYAWDNSDAAVLRRARAWWDGTTLRRQPHVLSTAPPALSIGYAGVPQGLPNVLSLLELQRSRITDAPAARSETRMRLSPASIRRPDFDPDLVLVGGSARRVAALPRDAAIVMPLRVHLVVDVPADLTTLRQSISKRERSYFNARRAEHGWRLSVRDDDETFDFFYRRMHVPTMHARHAEHARSERSEVARDAILARGAVFLVEDETGPVAGALCLWQPRDRTLTTRLLGVLDGSSEHYESGAFKAVYHLLLEWAVEHHVRHVDLHGTESFVSKGIFQWKRRLHPRVALPPNHFAHKRLWMQVRHDAPEVRSFLVDNPTLAFTEGGQLEAVYFFDRDRAPRTDLDATCHGVAGRRLVDLDEFLDGHAPGRHDEG